MRVHRIANVLDKLPKRLHVKAKAALHEIMRAETPKAAQQAIVRFEADYGANYPKAVASLPRDEAELLAFFDFPAEPADGLPASGHGRAPLAAGQRPRSRAACEGRGSVQRRHSNGRAKCRLTWSRGRIHGNRTVG